MKLTKLVTIFSLVATLRTVLAAGTTPPCLNKISGIWNFGSVPAACNVSNMESPAVLRAQYKDVLFNDAQGTTGGRNKYMSDMYPVLREAAKYYIHRRNPQVSPAEEDAFILALMSLANQESYWTHYRDGADGILRFMRGDSLHGFGMMQIDDRSHLAEINAGKGVDLVENMIYGLDIYYANWVKAETASCVSSPTNYRERTRSAWSAYNGGPNSICRWKDPNSPYKQNDIDFNMRIEKQAWKAYVADFKAPSKLDIRCLAEGTRPCPGGGGKKTVAPPKVGVDLSKPVAKVKAGIPYRFLRECPRAECDRIPGAVRGAQVLQLVNEGPGEWSLVGNENALGWILRSDLDKVR